MKINLLCSLVIAASVVGCAETRKYIGAAENDHNVLTGGPISGTTIQDLPQSVRNTLRQRVPNAEIADIDRTTQNGRVVYEIAFTEAGRNPKLFISAEGQIIEDMGASPESIQPARVSIGN